MAEHAKFFYISRSHSILRICKQRLTLKTGQTHVHKYLDILMHKIVNNEIDPSFVINTSS